MAFFSICIMKQHSSQWERCPLFPRLGTLFDFTRTWKGWRVCVLTERWMSDARPPLMSRIQMGFCSVREHQPRQMEWARDTPGPSVNSFHAFWQTVLQRLVWAKRISLLYLSVSDVFNSRLDIILKASNYSGTRWYSPTSSDWILFQRSANFLTRFVS